jgi:PleD family two-component response regulator
LIGNGIDWTLVSTPGSFGRERFRLWLLSARDSRPAQSRVLVVEDDPASQELVRALLESAGYLVEVAGAASIALRCVEARRPVLQ